MGSGTLGIRTGEVQFGGKTKTAIFFLHSISETAVFNKVQGGLELITCISINYQLAKVTLNSESSCLLVLELQVCTCSMCWNYRCALPCLSGFSFLNNGSAVLCDRTLQGET